MDVDQIADALAQHRTSVMRELLAPLEQHQIECLLGFERPLNTAAFFTLPVRVPVLGGEHHDDDDAFWVYFELIAYDGDITEEIPLSLLDFRGRPRVNPQLVNEHYFALRNQVSTE